MSTARKIILFLIAICISPTVASAASVVSTGVAGVGNPESSWTVTLSGNGLPLTAVSNECCFGGAWVNSTQPANWITPYADNNLAQNDPNANTQDAEYLYTLQFDNPNQSLTISWASDNDAIFNLNNTEVSHTNFLLPQPSYKNLVTFTIGAGDFAPGVNTFTVDLFNRAASSSPGNPTGLLVQVSAVPLPATLPLFASGLAGLGWLSRRKKRVTQGLA